MSRTFTRRGFLELAGSLGGSTAVYRAAMGMGLLPVAARAARPVLTASGKSKKVLVLGAGISGLTAAYELDRKGYEVQVLEASFRAGGRNLTARHGSRIDETGYPQVCNFDDDPDLYFNCGPARIPGHHVNLLGYCKELEVELEPFINDNRNAWVQDDAMFGGKPIRAREYLSDTRGFVAELMAKSINKEAISGPMTPDDWDRLREYLKQFGELDPQFRYIGTSRAGLARHDYTAPEVLKTPLSPSELLKWKFMLIMSFGETDNQAAMMMEPVVGMVVGLAETHDEHELRLQQLARRERRLQYLGRRVIVPGEARAAGPDVPELRIEFAELLQILPQSIPVVRRHRPADRLLVDRLGHELGDEAARIAQVFTRADPLAAEHRVVLHPGVAVVVDEGL